MLVFPQIMTSPTNTPVQHIFSVDVEDYFQVNAFEATVQRSQWDSFPSRIERNMDRLLDLLNRKKVLGTFFTLGWIGRKFPEIVRRIAGAGHEIASHGFWHRRVTELSREEFREEVRSSRALLEDLSGGRVHGFRAPSFSIVPGTEWAFDVLLEEGYGYDSSLFPIRRPGYGYPGADPVPHVITRPSGSLLELPPATWNLAGLRIPAAGGGYFRQFPYSLFRRTFGSLTRRGITGMFYIHPWEIDPEQPRLPVSRMARFRHYTGLNRTMPRLERLLSEFRFTSVAHRFGGGSATQTESKWASVLPN
jgi:polysaccharide deacetylase family protein (PEP-CTERM system associated)